MNILRAHPRPLMTAAYGLSSSILLYLFNYDSYFCAEAGKHAALRAVVRLTLFLILIDGILSFVAAALGLTRRVSRSALVVMTFLCTLAATVPLVGWLYMGYGQFRFKGTSLDVSCLFYEGYGMAFSFVLAPALSMLAGPREFVVGRLLNSQAV